VRVSVPIFSEKDTTEIPTLIIKADNHCTINKLTLISYFPHEKGNRCVFASEIQHFTPIFAAPNLYSQILSRSSGTVQWDQPAFV
jgi:hypothetical protein